MILSSRRISRLIRLQLPDRRLIYLHPALTSAQVFALRARTRGRIVYCRPYRVGVLEVQK